MADANTHEDLKRDETVEGPGNRSFGLTVGGIFVAIGVLLWLLGSSAIWLRTGLLAVGFTLVVLGLVAPGLLTQPNRLWMQLSLLLAKITNPIVMGILYVSTVVPIGLIMRLLGKDLLSLRIDRSASTYWIDRTPPGPSPESIERQF